MTSEKKANYEGPNDTAVSVKKSDPRWRPTVAEGVDEWCDEMLAGLIGDDEKTPKKDK